MSIWIAGIGTAVPPQRIEQMDAAAIAQRFSCETEVQRRQFHTLYRWATVETRHSVVLAASDGDLEARQSFYTDRNPTTRDRMDRFEAEANTLALSAAQTALADAGIGPERVTHLITVTCSGFAAPGFDIALMKQLPLRTGAARTQLGFMGCHGALNGLRVLRAFLTAEPAACVLLCAVELCSLHHQYGWDPEQIVANSLFADGAAAVVGLGADSAAMPAGRFQIAASGSTLLADSEDAMTWRIGDHGFTMTLATRVPQLIARHLRPWLVAWLAEHGQTLESVRSWAVHPGGPRILAVVREALGLDHEALDLSYQVLTRYGNMSSPTVLFILDQMRHRGARGPCVTLGFGPGLVVEAALLL